MRATESDILWAGNRSTWYSSICLTFAMPQFPYDVNNDSNLTELYGHHEHDTVPLFDCGHQHLPMLKARRRPSGWCPCLGLP